MKKVLLTSTALVLSAGVAAADVSVGGNGYMGVRTAWDNVIADAFDDDLTFRSRLRITFAASGETDSGLAFGGSVRADNAVGGAAGTAGSVFVEGSFGKLSMGDVDGAAEQAVGDVSGVGYEGLGDLNETAFLTASDDPTALYEYSTGDLSFYLSAGQLQASDEVSVGVSYSMGNISVGLGWEADDAFADDHVVASASAGFGDATVKVVYGDLGPANQVAVSLDYVFGATTATLYYADNEINSTEAYGLGVAYDLGGGAALKAGYVKEKVSDSDGFGLGITMSF